MQYSVGIGITNECNLQCPHCYSRAPTPSRLSLSDVKAICEKLAITSINLGTGESGLHPEWLKILEYLLQKDIRLGLTSNGYTVVNSIPRESLSFFNDIDISIDFPSREQHEAFRGQGSWDQAIKALEICSQAGVETSVVACMMNQNYDQMVHIGKLAVRLGANFRVNVYKPSRSRRFSLTYDQFWYGIRSLLSSFALLSCTEPIVNAMTGIELESGPVCGRKSLRVTPDGFIIPCVYWPKGDIRISDITKQKGAFQESGEFKKVFVVPERCLDCQYVTVCRGGCSARRLLRDALEEPDEFCPIVRGEQIHLDYEMVSIRKELVHAGYLCTLIFGTRP